jgi:hypothetical protein
MRTLKNNSLKFSLLLVLVLATGISGQSKIKWMSVGSMHNWYSNIGSEIEEGFVLVQQYGWRWPALYEYQDIQAWKGMWVGAKGFTDAAGKAWGTKVVHVGPRVSGANEFFPVKFKLKAKFPKPTVYVDGALSEREAGAVDVEVVDPTMIWDREIETVCNTQLGLTMTRKIYQFSNQFHDNYIVNEYIYTNTGKADPADTTKVTLPNQTLDSVMIWFQYRLAPCRQTRYVVNNATGWGKNTIYDARGDGKSSGVTNPTNWNNSVAGEAAIRCQFAWHGKFTQFTDYDNIGGPIFKYVTLSGLDNGDTVGRLGAPQFAGIATLYADSSATIKVDAKSQPTTTNTFFSDDILQRGNDAGNEGKCQAEYVLMTEGHKQRHLDQVGEANLIVPTKDVFLGDNGGLSMGNGYGPYKIKFGESIRIVFVEATAGMSREKAIEIGKAFKSNLNVTAKNTEVMKGKDSLMWTFKRAIENFNSNWTIAEAPTPPKEFFVDGLGEKVSLKWSLFNESDPKITGFLIYRAIGKRDSNYAMIADLPASARSYDDTAVPRSVNVYYYIQSVGPAVAANAALNTWAGKLVSNLSYTLTADPTYLKREPGTSMNDIRVVPNPYNIASDATNMRFPEKRDRLFFYNIPGDCSIRIYTEYGELIKTLEHTNGTGDEPWDCVTSSNQIVVSGIYIAVVRNNVTGDAKIVKFVVIR